MRLEKAGQIEPGLTLYGLRHTVAVILRECGFDERTIADPVEMARHYARGADLRLANGARGLNVYDYSELHIDQIVVGVRKKRWPSHRTGPLGSRIGRRHKLRRDVACRTEGSCSGSEGRVA